MGGNLMRFCYSIAAASFLAVIFILGFNISSAEAETTVKWQFCTDNPPFIVCSQSIPGVLIGMATSGEAVISDTATTPKDIAREVWTKIFATKTCDTSVYDEEGNYAGTVAAGLCPVNNPTKYQPQWETFKLSDTKTFQKSMTRK